MTPADERKARYVDQLLDDLLDQDERHRIYEASASCPLEREQLDSPIGQHDFVLGWLACYRSHKLGTDLVYTAVAGLSRSRSIPGYACKTRLRQSRRVSLALTVCLYGSIQADPARFYQLHDGQGGKGFAGRTQEQRSVSSHGLASRVGYTKSLEVDDFVALHDAERDTWNVHGFPFARRHWRQSFESRRLEGRPPHAPTAAQAEGRSD